MKLKASETIKMTLDDGAAHMANHTYHVHPHTGERMHCAFPGDDSMEGISLLPECVLQDNDISALAKVAGEWEQEAGRTRTREESGGGWKVAAIWRAMYGRGESMIGENTQQIFPMVPN